MKSIFFLGLIGLLMGGCVNQNIAARRSDIPWNAPARADAAGALPTTLVNQYED